MKRSKTVKRIKRIIIWGFILVVSYCTLHILLVAFPQLLFHHNRTYKTFTVYMRQEVPTQITDVLDRAEVLLEASELYDPSDHHRMVFVNSFRLSRYLLLRNVHFGCNPAIAPIYITSADVTNDIARCELIRPDDQRIRTLSNTIVHEITHQLLINHIGWSADRKLPTWIKEGYCDFIAQGSAIELELGVSMMTSSYQMYTPGLANFRYRIVMQYLINDRDMTIDEIIRQRPNFAQIEAEVIAALREDKQGFLRRIKPSR